MPNRTQQYLSRNLGAARLRRANIGAVSSGVQDYLKAQQAYASRVDAAEQEFARQRARQRQQELGEEDTGTQEQVDNTTDQNNSILNAAAAAVGGLRAAGQVSEAIGAATHRLFQGQNFSDNYNSFLSKMNEVQSSSAKGVADAATRLSDMIDGAERYYNALQRLPEMQRQLNSVREQAAKTRTPQARQSLLGYANSIQQAINDLNRDIEQLKPVVDKLATESHQSEIGAAIDQALSGPSSFGSSIWGKVTPIHDRANDIKWHLQYLGDSDVPIQNKLKMLRDAKNAASDVLDDMRAIQDENTAEAKMHENRISKAFRTRRDTPGMDLTDPDTYLYKLSGVMGSSASSWMKQIPALGIGVAATAAAPATGGLSLAAAAPAVFELNQASGRDENYAEVQQAANEAFSNKLTDEEKAKIVKAGKQQLKDIEDPNGNIHKVKDFSDSEFIDQYLAGNIHVNDNSIASKRADVSENIPSLFNRDMAATTWDSTVDTALSLMPIGALSGLSRLKFMKNLRKPLVGITRRLEQTGLGSAAMKGASAGAKVGGTTSVLGTGIGAIAGAGLRSAEYGVEKGLSTIGALDHMGQLGKFLDRRLNSATKVIKALKPEDIVKLGKNEVRKKYFKDITGKLALSSMSEGVEEGKQHKYAEQFKNGGFKYGDDGFINIAADDMLNGLEMGATILGIPMDGLGLISLKDQDLLADIKGGMLGGFQHVGTMNLLQNIRPYKQEINAVDAITKNLISTKTEARDLFNKNMLYAKGGFFAADKNRFDVAFDLLRSYNRQHRDAKGEYIIDPDLIDKEQERMGEVQALVDSDTVRQAAKGIGILKGVRDDITNNKEYQKFASAVALVKHYYDTAAKNRKDVADQESDLDSEVRQKYMQQASDILSDIMSTEDDVDQNEVNEADKKKALTDAQIDNKLNFTKGLAQLAALYGIRKNIEEGLDVSTQLDELGVDKRINRVKNGQKEYLDWVNKRIDELEGQVSSSAKMLLGFKSDGGVVFQHKNDTIRTLDDIRKLIVDPEAHDQYTQMYRDLYQADAAVSMHAKTLQNILGQGKDKKFWSKLSKQIDDAKISDNDFWNAFETHDFDADNETTTAQDRDDGWSNLTYEDSDILPVMDGTGNQATVEVDDKGVPTTKLGDGMFVRNGKVWKRVSKFTAEYNDKPIFGEWDKTQEDNENNTFEGLLGGNYVKVDPKDPKTKSMKVLLRYLRMQNSRKQREDEESRIAIDESDEGGNTIELTPEQEAEAQRSTAGKAAMDSYKRQRKADENKRNKQLANSKETGVYLDKDQQMYPIYHDEKADKYFVVRKRGNGSYFRDYNIDVDSLFVDTTKQPYQKPEIQVSTFNSQRSDATDQETINYLTSFEDIQKALNEQNKKPSPPQNPETLSSQQKTLNKLEQKRADDEKNVGNDPKGYHLTSTAYFIKNKDGRYVRYPRVHSVKQEYITRPQEQIDFTFYRSKFQPMSLDDIIKWLDDIFQTDLSVDEPDKYGDLKVYYKYISDSKRYIEGDNTELSEIKRDIAHIMSSGDYGPSVVAGNTVDQIARIFFGDHSEYDQYVKDKDKYVKQILNTELEQYPGRKVSDYFTENAVRELLDDLKLQQDNFDNMRWKLSTYGYTWHADFKETKVAGVTDLIAVDEQGKIHIIDFKTSKYPFSGPNSYFLYQKEVPGGTKKMSTKDDYTNQQTLYAMMIKYELGDDVESTELMPFVLQYDNGNQTFPVLLVRNNDNGKPSRIILERSDDPFDTRFTGKTTISENDAHNRSMELRDLETSLGRYLSDTQSFLEETKDWKDSYPELQSIAQFVDSINDKFGEINKNLTDYSTENFQKTDVYDLAKAYIDQLQQLNDQWPNISEDIKVLKGKHSDYLDLHKPTPPAPPESPKNTQQTSDGSTEVFADNKGFGTGADRFVNIDYNNIKQRPDLAQATIQPDFITNSKISIHSKTINGKIELYADVSYNGKTWNDLYLRTNNSKDTTKKTVIGQALIDQIVSLEKKNPGKKIYVINSQMNRTNGRIVFDVKDGQPVVRNVSDTDLVQDFYDIDFTQDYSSVGFYQKGNVVVFDKNNASMRIPIYTYTGVENNKYGEPAAPVDGQLVWIKKIHHNESGKTVTIPVTVRRRTYTSGDADFIIDAVVNGKLYQDYILPDGTNTHIPIRKLVNFLIPLASERNTETVEGIFTLVTSNDSQTVRLLTRQQLATGQMTNAQQYDLSTDEGKSAFKNTLMKLYIEEQHDILTARFGSDKNERMPFADIYRYFANSEANNLKISDTLDFDIQDFSKHKSLSTGKEYQGLSGAGWYVKHGIWNTTYKYLGQANVSIGRFNASTGQFLAPPVQVEGNEKISDSDAFEAPILPPTDSPVTDDSSTGTGFEDYWSDTPLFKRADNKKHSKRIDKERSIRRMKKILGENAPIEFISDIEELSKWPASVLGTCTKDAVKVTSQAYDGVEFHEAFHRVLELIASDSERDKVYKQIAKHTGFSLSSIEGRTDIAEYAADGFMDYMHGYAEKNIPILSKVYNKIRDWVLFITHFSQRDLYRMYAAAARGRYATNEEIPDSHITRWTRSFQKDALHYDVHGVHFDNILNDYMYGEVKDTTMMMIIKGADIDRSGSDIDKLGRHIDQETFKKGVDWYNEVTGGDVLGEKTSAPTSGQAALKEMYDNLKYDEIRTDMADWMSFLATDYRPIQEQEEIEDADGGEAAKSKIGDHTRLAYEFSKFSKTSKRVKFFFATIPDQVYREVVTKDPKTGKDVKKRQFSFVLNELGLPKYVPVSYMFNDFLNKMHDCDSIQEVLQRCQKYGQTDPLYQVLGTAIYNIYTNTYIMKNGKVTSNPDYEALITQLMGTIRSNKHNFIIMRSKENKAGINGKYTLKTYNTDMDYNANNFVLQWGNMLANGGTPYITISKTGAPQINPRIKGAAKVFGRIADQFDHSERRESDNGQVYYVEGLKQWLNSVTTDDDGDIIHTKQSYFVMKVVDQDKSTSEKTVYKDKALSNPSNPSDLDLAKTELVRMLNAVGIAFSRPELDYLLLNKYGDTDYRAMQQMFNSSALEDSMSSFVDFLRTLTNGQNLNINDNGEVPVPGSRKPVALTNVFTKMAFVKDLANWKYQYQHAHDQLTVLATHGKYYQMSDNNYITDVVRGLNKRGEEYNELISQKDPYYYFEGDTDRLGNVIRGGSYVAMQLKDDPKAKLECVDFVGFRTDKRGDQGQDYFEISNRQDYVSKAELLSQGFIIFPTMSDKKTWKFLTGILLPGLDYTQSTDKDGKTIPNPSLAEQSMIRDVDGTRFIKPLQSVIDVFIGYAQSEYMSIKQAISDINKMNDAGDKAHMTANYYAKGQGARFSSLLGVYTDADNDNHKLEYKSFNDKNKTPEQNLKIAEKYFFNLSKAEQEVLISRNLMHILQKEFLEAERLKLIKRRDGVTDPVLMWENIGLDSAPIDAIYKAQEARIVEKHNGRPIDQITSDNLKAFSLALYMYDVSNRAIMSGQEIERLFSGNPAFYKWKYDDNGQLIDRTVDELKRLGGLVSTGVNNFLELQDIPDKYKDQDGNFTGKYVCAEADNELIQSPQYQEFVDQMYSGQLATTVYNKLVDERIDRYLDGDVGQDENGNIVGIHNLPTKEQPTQDVIDAKLQKIRGDVQIELDGKSIEELESYLDKQALEVLHSSAKQMSDAYAEGIDVADGAAYVTDTMMEMILRMNGSWSADIAKAFETLRNDDVTDVLTKASAYQKVMTTVIGTQKYTAFGRREHSVTGIPITYYNKYALFPIFKSMATGKLMNVYNAVVNQGVDMLMINSAVKVGSEGSTEIDWNVYRQTNDPNDPNNYTKDANGNTVLKPLFSDGYKMNTYQQKFKYLRKQLNTDPSEEKYQNFGTQMTKIVESNYQPYEKYCMQDGTTRTGKELLEDIMGSTNALSDIGREEIAKLFFKTNKDGDLVDENNNVIQYDSRDANGVTRLVLDQKKFSKQVRDALTEKDPNKNIIRALDVVEYKDENNQTQYKLRVPLDAVQNSKWFESILISKINSKVIDIESPGAPFIQRSVWAMEGSTLYDSRNGKILSDENMPPSINGGKRLQAINEEGSMDCVLSVDFFRKILSKNGKDPFEYQVRDSKTDKPIYDRVKDANGNYIQKKDKEGKLVTDKAGNPVYVTKPRMVKMSFQEIRSFLMQRGIIGSTRIDPKTGKTIPGAKANIVAYRIPTQAQSSIHALRCVDIIPDVNDTVILPAEFTRITGSDFDIDKLFLSSMNYDIRREKDNDGKTHLIVSDQYEEKSKQWYQNKLLRDYLTFLLDKDSENGKPRHWNILHRSIDNDTQLLKDVLNDIEGKKAGEPEIPYGFYSLYKQTQSKNDYITGKIGIGPYALNNNNHILTMLYNISFKDSKSSILHALGLNRIDRYNDINGKPILSWLSGLINAHVDIAKDPWISRLNVGPFTYNLSNLLVRVGLGKNTFYYLKQPILEALAQAYTNASSLYMQEGNSTYQAQKQALKDVADSWFKGNDRNSDIKTTTGISYRDAVKMLTNKASKMAHLDDIIKLNQEIANMMRGDEIRNMAKNDGGTKEQQLMVYLAYLQLDKYAQSLSNLVKYCKIDTKKQGKSVAEQYAYKKGYDKLFDIEHKTDNDGLIEESGLMRLRDDSYVGRKTDNALACVQDVLGQQFMQSTPAFLSTVDGVISTIGKAESVSAQLFSDVSTAIGAAVKSEYFNERAKYEHSNNPHFMHDLVSSSAEWVGFSAKKNSNIVDITSTPVYSLRSYVGKPISFWYKGNDGKWYTINSTIKGVDEQKHQIILSTSMPYDLSGKTAYLSGGANTIYDRLNRLSVRIHSDSRFANLLNPSGEINNLLLRSLIPGKTYEFSNDTSGMRGLDEYQDLKFVKLFNFLDDGGINANFIIDAWDELLHYTNDNKAIEKYVRDFANDLVYYAFVTSGDTSGFTKMFKYVPESWREQSYRIGQRDLSYANFISEKINEMKAPVTVPGIDISDILRNNWYNNTLVPTYRLSTKSSDNFITVYKKANQFIPQVGKYIWVNQTSYPTIIAALHKNEDGEYEAFIDPDKAPRFIKVPRTSYSNMTGSQRDYTLYRLAGVAESSTYGVRYPVYIKDNPKGQSVDRFIVTEYGRNDGYTAPQEYEVDYNAFDKYWRSDQFLEQIPMIQARGDNEYLQILKDLRNESKLSDKIVNPKDLENKNNSKPFDDSDFDKKSMDDCKGVNI